LSPLVEVRLIVAREVRRSVRSAKGIVLAVLTLLGALVSALVCVQIEGSERTAVEATSNEAFIELKRKGLEQLTGDASLAAYMASVPTSLLVFLKITVWFLPLLVALLGFDAVAGDLQQKSVRFWTIRSRRGSYFTGKLLGLWVVVGLIALVLNVLADGVAVARGYVTLGQAVAWGLRFWVVAVVIAGAWTAVATFISASFRAPILALLTTFATFFVMWLFGLGGFIARVHDSAGAGLGGIAKEMSWYEYLYPNSYDAMLISAEGVKVLTAVGILVGFVAAMAAAGSALFARRDV
jgi:ABC-type transport system involved in multi-copper enzyme maturation permease subunit